MGSSACKHSREAFMVILRVARRVSNQWALLRDHLLFQVVSIGNHYILTVVKCIVGSQEGSIVWSSKLYTAASAAL